MACYPTEILKKMVERVYTVDTTDLIITRKKSTNYYSNTDYSHPAKFRSILQPVKRYRWNNARSAFR